MRKLFCNKMQQKFITKCVRYFITKCNSCITKRNSYDKMYYFYYKLRQLLRNAMFITKSAGRNLVNLNFVEDIQ